MQRKLAALLFAVAAVLVLLGASSGSARRATTPAAVASVFAGPNDPQGVYVNTWVDSTGKPHGVAYWSHKLLVVCVVVKGKEANVVAWDPRVPEVLYLFDLYDSGQNGPDLWYLYWQQDLQRPHPGRNCQPLVSFQFKSSYDGNIVVSSR